MGIYLGIATIFAIMTVLFFNPFFNKVFNNYYAMASLGIVFFIYFWVIRYQEDVMNLINGTSFVNGEFNSGLDGNISNVKISKVFLLDLCPFVAVAFSFLLTFDRNRNVLKIISPLAFFGGCITIFGQVMWDDVGASNNFYPISNGWDFIFGNEAYFLMHFYSTIIALIIFVNSKGFGWKGLLGSLIFPLAYFAYVMIFVTQFGVTKNATGLVAGDWMPGGQYYVVSTMFNGMAFPYITVLCYTLVAVYVYLIIFWRNILIFDNKWKHSEMIVLPRTSVWIRSIVNKINKAIKKI